MFPSNPLKMELEYKVLARQTEEARYIARRLGPESGDVLLALAGNQTPTVRLLVLTLASENPSANASRAIVSRLNDGNPTVSSVARSLIGFCAQKEVVPDLEEAMKSDLPPSVKSAIALQIGMLGDTTSHRSLREQSVKAQDPQLRHDIDLAMARLGSASHRQQVIDRLRQPLSDVETRVQALRDTLYLGDRTLITHFRPALDDLRDAIDLSDPHEPPPVFARVCDVAIQTMGALGTPFSFAVGILVRHSDVHLLEARAIVNALQ